MLSVLRPRGHMSYVAVTRKLARPGGKLEANSVWIEKVNRTHEGCGRDLEARAHRRIVVADDTRHPDAFGPQLVVILVDLLRRNVECHMVHRGIGRDDGFV